MGPIEQIIKHKLEMALTPVYLEVINESFMHAVPEGSESHFKLVIVSDQFDNISSVRRHQRVYKLLADELAGSLHALALHTYTAADWAENLRQTPVSPDCMGGSKQD